MLHKGKKASVCSDSQTKHIDCTVRAEGRSVECLTWLYSTYST